MNNGKRLILLIPEQGGSWCCFVWWFQISKSLFGKGWIWNSWVNVCSFPLNSWNGKVPVLLDIIPEIPDWNPLEDLGESFQTAVGDLQMDVSVFVIPLWRASLMASFVCWGMCGTFPSKSLWEVGLPFTGGEWILTGMHNK